MKRRLMVAVAAAALLGSTLVGTTSAVSENANQQACFGQGRAAFASANGRLTGEILSGRAGNNAEINRAEKVRCEAAAPD